LTWVAAANAQQTAAAPDSTQQIPIEKTAPPCIKPAPMLSYRDYEGPYQKVVGAFGRRLERRSAHPPRPPKYKPGAALCVLDTKGKFTLFLEDTFDPVTFFYAGFYAGISQAQNSDRSFGQGGAGYGKRFGASFTDQASGEFFKEFAYPTVFAEDPRYYRMAHGDTHSRFLHAMGHVFVAHGNNGAPVFNFTEWLGTTSAVALSNLYHPGNRRGFTPAAQRVGFTVSQDMGYDILREFWPEIAHKLKLPFREQHEALGQGASGVSQAPPTHH
jgi:hypothetical protein